MSGSISSRYVGLLCLLCFLIRGDEAAQRPRASSPPRGWNSYDSFSWIISEKEFLDNAQIVSEKLLQHGYEYVVVDYLWYRRRVPGANTNSKGFDVIDEWGRPIPDPGRWPSSKDGQGFKSIARRVHEMGLKFGIHVMRGISTQAVNANTPIMGPQGHPYKEGGRIWRARDIGLTRKPCKWMSAGFMSVDTRLGAGRAFLRSLYQQYAEWGVDFVKHDCVFGDDLNVDEIIIVSKILKDIDRPILYSISPGKSVKPNMGMKIAPLVNMYRVTGDDWDTWKDLQPHFNVAREFARTGLIGAQGLHGKSWPDLDMLPFGSLTNPGVNEGPHRVSRLTLNEQKTEMTLWAMAKSPIMFGGDLRKIDHATMSLITNPTLLYINTYSTNNKEFPFITSNQQHLRINASQILPNSNITRRIEINGVRAWIAIGKAGEAHIAFFNLSPNLSLITAKVKDVMEMLDENGMNAKNKSMILNSQFERKCTYREVWSNDLGVVRNIISMEVPSHGCALFTIKCS